MDMYGKHSASIPQKLFITASEVALVVVSYQILFGTWFSGYRDFGANPSHLRNALLLAFIMVMAARFALMMFAFLQRHVLWAEAISNSVALAFYIVGFPLLARSAAVPLGLLAVAGVALFAIGSFTNTFAEYQRRRFKALPDSKGKLFTGGLFSLSMHVNYFGDILWVAGFACITHNAYAFLYPASLFLFFYFGNVPKLDAHLREHYGDQFAEYERTTKRLIPFVL